MAHSKWMCIFILFMYIAVLNGQKTLLDSTENIKLLREFKEFFLNVYGQTGSSDNLVFKEAQTMQHVQEQVSKDTAFPCNVSGGRSPMVPTSVDKLRPGDIDIIGAMGDSLTAGFGIFGTNLVNMFVENRGASAFGGGQTTWRQILTLPNILKEYNPQLYGYSTEDSFTHQSASRFNVGENLAMSRDLPFMANNLVQRMKNDARVDIKNHWKIINIFIGANDICADMCWVNPPSKILTDHKNHLIATLRILRDNLPRTLVSVVVLPNLVEFVNSQGRPPICQLFLRLGCSCLLATQFRNQQKEFIEIIKKWQELDEQIPTYPEFQRQDFSVVSQSFSRGPVPVTSNGHFDLRYTSADCFHFSQLMHARVAVAMWTNLFQAPEEKSTMFYDESAFPCPKEEKPYFATPGNS